MPIRFSTEAANADVLGDDADTSGSPGMPKALGGDRRTPQHFSRSTARGGNSPDAPADQAKPGKDINAAGFVKDKDSSKP